MPSNKISNSKLILITALFIMVFGNFSFISNVLKIYPINLENSIFLLSLGIFFICVNVILFSLVCFKQTTKYILIGILLGSSLAAYFMDTYGVIIDDSMIDNIIRTDANEALDLFSFKQLLYFILLGVIPSVSIYKVKVIKVPLKKAILSNIILLASAFLVSVIIIFSLNNFYASFFREHKPLRFYANPSYYVYSSIKYLNGFFKIGSEPLKQIGLDAGNHGVSQLDILLLHKYRNIP